MQNIIDYLDWRGDVPFSAAPFNPVDNLILSQFSYISLDGIAPGTMREVVSELIKLGRVHDNNLKLSKRLAESRRFGSARVSHSMELFDPKLEMQFGALVVDTDDGATWTPVEARAEDSKPSIGGCTSAVVDGALVTDENGVTTFNGLQIDNQTVTILYRLTETGTKSGNTLLAAPLFIGSLPQVLDDGTETVDVVVTAVNNQSFTLPSSGGNGMMGVPVGIALALISASCILMLMRKKKF